MKTSNKYLTAILIVLIAMLYFFLPETFAQRRISEKDWQEMVDDKYERYGLYDMDWLIFESIEDYFDAGVGSEEESFYLRMIYNFLINKHLRLKRAQWEIENVEFTAELMKKYERKYWIIQNMLGKK